MKRTLLTVTVFVMAAGMASAQYCTFIVDYVNSFNAGITNVTLDSNPAINRTSTTTENNGFTDTGVTVAVTKGQTYTIGVTANQDNLTCGNYNIVVYIDFNNDSDYDDAGEDAVSMLNVVAGVQTQSFTVPATAATGQTGMRIALKMIESCGHSAIDPCNIPADPLGWHGEVENYTLDIQATTGIENYITPDAGLAITNNKAGMVQIAYELQKNSNVSLQVYNMLGQEVNQLVNGNQSAGQHNVEVNTGELNSGAVYFARLAAGETTYTKKFIVR